MDFGERYIKFIVTYCNTKCGNRNIWLLLIVSGKSTSDRNEFSDLFQVLFNFCFQTIFLKDPSVGVFPGLQRLQRRG